MVVKVMYSFNQYHKIIDVLMIKIIEGESLLALRIIALRIALVEWISGVNRHVLLQRCRICCRASCGDAVGFAVRLP